MAPVLRARGARSDAGSGEEEDGRAQSEVESAGIDGIRPAMSAPTSGGGGGGGDVPASPRPKRSKASRESADASPNSKKARKRARKPSPPPPNGTAEGGGGVLPGADAPTNEADPAGEVAAPPANGKGAAVREEERAAREEDGVESGDASPARNNAAAALAALAASPKRNKGGVASPRPKRAKKPAHGTEDGVEPPPKTDAPAGAADLSGEAVAARAAGSDGDAEVEGVVGSGEASPVRNVPAAAAASPQNKKERVMSVQPKRGKKAGSGDEEPEAAEKEDGSGKALPELNGTADKVAAAKRKKRSKPSGDIPKSPKRKKVSKRSKEGRKLPAPALHESVMLAPDQGDEIEGIGQEDGAVMSDIAPPKGTASPPKPRSSGKEKKPAVERSWSMEDEFRILTAMAEHAQAHGGALPEASDLFVALSSSFDRRDANVEKLANKVRKLKWRYERVRSKGCPTDEHGCRLFKLCEIVWGSGALQVSSPGASSALRRSMRKTSNSSNVVPEEPYQEDGKEHTNEPPAGTLTLAVCSVPFVKDGDGSGKSEGNGSQDKQAKVTSVRRDFSEMSKLYPFLAEEFKRFADTHNSGKLTLAAFEAITDDVARDLDARCKQQRINKFNLEMSQTELTKALLCALAGRMD